MRNVNAGNWLMTTNYAGIVTSATPRGVIVNRLTAEMNRDTFYVINGEYDKETILRGLSSVNTPVFDRVASVYFSRGT